jgi:hypothetical protein
MSQEYVSRMNMNINLVYFSQLQLFMICTFVTNNNYLLSE